MKQYFVYMLASNSRVIYIGITSDLIGRVWQHKNKETKGFTEKYNVNRLVYYEQTDNVWSALEREKQLKKWSRKKKIFLIEKENPEWDDLYGNL